ncbi:MAG: hypothetical protein TREMPRED_004864 [Tremellales sp. Tagirdzhanova-0007]|nr:MAG: hypothetical protein TREMPRED_004864 [Tremellales sp. Tagirdzhanova-0007]
MPASERSRLLDDGVGENGESSSDDGTKEKSMNKAGLTRFRFLILLLGLFATSFLVAVDGTIVATLATAIGSDFGSSSLSSWVGTSYLLSSTCFSPFYGRLADIIGRRLTITVALMIFTTGTTICAVAPSMGILIAARALAGVGGAGLPTTISVIMSDMVSAKDRGVLQGYNSLVFALGIAVGAPLGGILADSLGWRWAFILQVPLLVIVTIAVFFLLRIPLYAVSKTLRQVAEGAYRRIDYLGSFTLTISVTSFILALTLATSTSEDAYSWSDPLVWGLVITSGVFLVLLLCVEKWTPALIGLNNLLLMIQVFSTFYNVPIFFTAVKLQSSSLAGAHLVPNSACIAVGSLLVGYTVRHIGRYYWTCLFCALGPIAQACWLSTWGSETSEFSLWAGLIPGGLGISGVLTATLVALVANVEKKDVSVATAGCQVLGVSLSSATVQAVLQRQLEHRITGDQAKKIISQIRESTSIISELPPETQAAARDSWQVALRTVFNAQIACGCLVFLTVAFMRDVPLTEHDDAEEDEGEDED